MSVIVGWRVVVVLLEEVALEDGAGVGAGVVSVCSVVCERGLLIVKLGLVEVEDGQVSCRV